MTKPGRKKVPERDKCNSVGSNPAIYGQRMEASPKGTNDAVFQGNHTILRPFQGLLAVLILTALLAGAVAGQKKYKRPAVNTPDTFRGADNTLPADQSIGDLKWFEVFKDDELQK